MLYCRILFVCIIALFLSTTAEAAVFYVSNTLDAADDLPGDGICAATINPGPDQEIACTLRAAVQEAVALAGPDEIVLTDGTYLLTLAGADEDGGATGDLDVTDLMDSGPLVITGAGPEFTIIDGGGLDRVFHVSGSFVTIRGVTISGGSAAGFGGGIFGQAAGLTVEDSVFADNLATAAGGAIENESGTLLLTRTSLVANSASCGGGLDNFGAATLTNVTISGNSAACSGGGLYDYPFSMTNVKNSTLAFNTPNNIEGSGDSLRLSNTLLVVGPGEVNCVISSGNPGDIDVAGNFAGAEACGSIAAAAGAELLGGLTQAANGQYVHLPGVGNPAIGGGVNASCAGTDERGVVRPQGAVCDSGAVELTPLSLIAEPPPPAIWNTEYLHTFAASGEFPLTFSIPVGGMPAGLVFDSGSITGTSTALGTTPFTLRVVDGAGASAEFETSITVMAAPTTITGTPPAANWNQPYSFVFAGSGNGTLTFSVTAGAPPAGMTLDSSGVLSGTSTVLGQADFTVTLTDDLGQTSLPRSLTVNGTAASVSGTPPPATWNTAYNFAFTGTGNGALAYTIAGGLGTLPAGLSLSTAGVVSGTPTGSGLSSFTVRVTDATAQTASFPTGITVAGTAVSITGAPPQATVNAAYSFAFGGTGNGTLTFTLAGGQLPAGLQLGPTGSLSGTPTESGDFPITIEVRDSSGQNTSASYTVRVNAPPAITGLGDATMEANREQDITITIADDFTSVDQVTVTVSAGESPILSGVVLSGSGATRTLRITPAEDRTGVATITMVASDGLLSTTRAAIITVSNPGVPNPPAGLTAVLDGDAAVFTWQPPASGPVPTFFVLEGGHDASLVTLPVVNTGHATSHRLVVPGGTWFFRARSGNLAGTSAASNEISGAVGLGVPGPPLGLVAQVSGNQVQIAWQAPTAGGPVATQRIEVGTSPGASNTGVFALPGGQLATGGSLPDGEYFARVRGVNASGDGPPSNEVRFRVGGGGPCSQRPDPPVLLPASIANRLVTLTWRPPLNTAVSSYQVVVGSQPGQSDVAVFNLGAVTSFAAQAPPRTYYVSLIAGNSCGGSQRSNGIAVIVP